MVTNINMNFVRSRARVIVLDLTCAMDHTTCLKEASDKFVDWLENGTALSQDLRTLVYIYGWFSVVQFYINTLFSNILFRNDGRH